MRTVAIIPAAGSGNRMNRDVSKQYLTLAGKPILVCTLEVFEASPLVDALLVVVPSQDVESVRTDILAPWNLKKVAGIIPGGKERQDSVRAGIEALDGDAELVIIHDAVRPFITARADRELYPRCRGGRRRNRRGAGEGHRQGGRARWPDFADL